jgi:hypothetical protein
MESAIHVKLIGLSLEITVIVGLQVLDLGKTAYNAPQDVKVVIVQQTAQNA